MARPDSIRLKSRTASFAIFGFYDVKRSPLAGSLAWPKYACFARTHPLLGPSLSRPDR